MNIVRLLKVRNEIGILEENIRYYSNLGIPSVVLDNDSTDGTYELCQDFLKDGSIIYLDQIKTNGFERRRILSRLDDMCHAVNPDWALVADADEFMEPRSSDYDLRTLIETESKKDRNVIQGANMEFWMTPHDDASKQSIRERMKHYTFFPSQKFIAYQFVPGTSLVPYNNHAPAFPVGHTGELSDELIIIRHYKFQSLEQARAKIKRIVPTADNPSVGFHYSKFTGDESQIVIPAETLNRYDEDGKWNFDVKHFGNRMTRDELKNYFKLKTDDELKDWLKRRNPFFRDIKDVI